jgi:RHS repeat-associated protein
LTNGSSTTRFIHDADGLSVLKEADGSGTTTATYTHGSGLISQKRSTTTSYYHFEALGSARQLTNSSETVTDSYAQDAWGNLLSSSGSTTNPYRYIGDSSYYDDGASGLMLLGARYYDPTVGRFITQDPIGQAGGLNFYDYTSGNPVNAIDPSGLSWLTYSKGKIYVQGNNQKGYQLTVWNDKGQKILTTHKLRDVLNLLDIENAYDREMLTQLGDLVSRVMSEPYLRRAEQANHEMRWILADKGIRGCLESRHIVILSVAKNLKNSLKRRDSSLRSE